MNKFQEALNRLRSINLDRVLELLGYEGAISISDYSVNKYPNLEMSEDIATLQELINLITVDADKNVQQYKSANEVELALDNLGPSYVHSNCAECNCKFKKYSNVRVINNGVSYTTYSGWFDETDNKELKRYYNYGYSPSKEDNYTVVAYAPMNPSRNDAVMVAIEDSRKRLYLINQDGLECDDSKVLRF